MSFTDVPSTGVTEEWWNEYNGTSLMQVTIAFVVLNTAATFMRFSARYITKTPWGCDDIFILFGWISLTGLAATIFNGFNFGIGYHFLRVTTAWPGVLPNWGRNMLYAFPILYCFAAMFPRLSILALYLRIFSTRKARVIIYFLGTIIILTALVNIFVIGFQCMPQIKAWDPSIPGYCHSLTAHYAWGSLPNIVTDVAMLMLPMPYILRLNVPRHIKGSLVAIFLIGGVGLITACVRFIDFVLFPFYSTDPTWVAVPLNIWSLVEPSTYQISACFLACRPLLVALGRSMWVRKVLLRVKLVSGAESECPSPMEDRNTFGSPKRRTPNTWSFYEQAGLLRTDTASLSTQKLMKGGVEISEQELGREKDLEAGLDVILPPEKIHVRTDMRVEIDDE